MRIRDDKIIFSQDEIDDLDKTLSSIIKEGLIQFKKRIECDDWSHYPDGIVPIVDEFNPSADEDAVAMVEWRSRIEKMIAAFSEGPEPYWSDKFFEESDEFGKSRREGLELFIKHFCDLWN